MPYPVPTDLMIGYAAAVIFEELVSLILPP